MRAKMDYEGHKEKCAGRGVMVRDKASWPSYRRVGQPGSNGNRQLDPPQSPAKSGTASGAGKSRMTGWVWQRCCFGPSEGEHIWCEDTLGESKSSGVRECTSGVLESRGTAAEEAWQQNSRAQKKAGGRKLLPPGQTEVSGQP